MSNTALYGTIWFCSLSFFLTVAAWITHIATCLSTGAWGFLIAGAICFPIGIVHGIGIWFNFW